MDPTDIFQWPSVKNLKDHEECMSRCDSRKPTACEEGFSKGGRKSAQGSMKGKNFLCKRLSTGQEKMRKAVGERVEDAKVDEGQKDR